jgi:hypothetical protein
LYSTDPIDTTQFCTLLADLVVWNGISVTYLWGPLCGGREGGVLVGGDALE